MLAQMAEQERIEYEKKKQEEEEQRMREEEEKRYVLKKKIYTQFLPRECAVDTLIGDERLVGFVIFILG